uniref:Type I polyketide synthase ketoyl reductase domain protein n=1 Tax=Gambierdiscus polynesiensis TaxID=439318 RepID=A0A1S6K7W8_9DINO|nr:type I polyketide synthase ketoyl reductase domain protein [Gambierdiscus polynesiensis]
MQHRYPHSATMYDQDSGSLTMIGEQTQNIGPAYERVMADQTAVMSSGMCWPVEWFPEHLPIESASGNAMHFYLRALANPLQTVSQFPEVDHQLPSKEDVLVFSDSYGYCKEILDQAPPGRIGIQNVQTKSPDKYTEKDIKGLIAMHPWDLIIFAMGIDPPASNSVEDLHKTQNAILVLYLQILKKIGDDASRCKRLCVLTVDTFAEEPEIHQECGLGLITNATLFGMSNTARQEVQCPIQYIDTEWALRTENTKYLAAEIFRHASFGYNNVRILNKGRYVMRQVPSKPYENKPDFQLPEQGIIAISGGNGALGLVMGMWILNKAREQGGKKFSIEFLSRSMKISDQNMPNWKEIERLGAELGIEVMQAKMDCSKAESVDEYIRDKTPNLSGFIHSAGILQDSMLYNQTWEKFDAVFESKSRAALYVHDALERFENPDLEFFWMFSSMAVYGNMGQLNYSASNSFLDGLARHRRAMGKVAMAPQWGAWGDVGMAANLDDASRRRMASSPMPYFSNAEGLYGLECGLRSSLPYFAVFKFNPPMMIGMIQPDDLPMHNYTRNFSCEIVPPPPGDPNKNPYTTVSYEMRKENHFYPNGLVYQRHWPQLADEANYAL